MERKESICLYVWYRCNSFSQIFFAQIKKSQTCKASNVCFIYPYTNYIHIMYLHMHTHGQQNSVSILTRHSPARACTFLSVSLPIEPVPLKGGLRVSRHHLCQSLMTSSCHSQGVWVPGISSSPQGTGTFLGCRKSPSREMWTVTAGSQVQRGRGGGAGTTWALKPLLLISTMERVCSAVLSHSHELAFVCNFSENILLSFLILFLRFLERG